MTAPEPRPADDKTPDIIAASARPAGAEGQFDSETATTPPVRRRRIWRWLGGLLAALLALLLLAQVAGLNLAAWRTRSELADLLSFCGQAGIHPQIGAELPMTEAAQAFQRMMDGETGGKVVLTR